MCHVLEGIRMRLGIEFLQLLEQHVTEFAEILSELEEHNVYLVYGHQLGKVEFRLFISAVDLSTKHALTVNEGTGLLEDGSVVGKRAIDVLRCINAAVKSVLAKDYVPRFCQHAEIRFTSSYKMEFHILSDIIGGIGGCGSSTIEDTQALTNSFSAYMEKNLKEKADYVRQRRLDSENPEHQTIVYQADCLMPGDILKSHNDNYLNVKNIVTQLKKIGILIRCGYYALTNHNSDSIEEILWAHGNYFHMFQALNLFYVSLRRKPKLARAHLSPLIPVDIIDVCMKVDFDKVNGMAGVDIEIMNWFLNCLANDHLYGPYIEVLLKNGRIRYAICPGDCPLCAERERRLANLRRA